MWILTGQKAPDHSTIECFRQKHVTVAIEELFQQLVNVLYELNEIKFEEFFIDGTKIEANANRYTFVWKKIIVKNKAKMQEKISFLDQKCTDEGIEFVHGSEKRQKNCRNNTSLQQNI